MRLKVNLNVTHAAKEILMLDTLSSNSDLGNENGCR